MGKSSNVESHQFYCINCGHAGIPLPRRKNRQRERFHRKVMYCYHCHQEINHIECKNEEDVKIFKENFKNGVYRDEAEKSLDHVWHSRQWQIDLL